MKKIVKIEQPKRPEARTLRKKTERLGLFSGSKICDFLIFLGLEKSFLGFRIIFGGLTILRESIFCLGGGVSNGTILDNFFRETLALVKNVLDEWCKLHEAFILRGCKFVDLFFKLLGHFWTKVGSSVLYHLSTLRMSQSYPHHESNKSSNSNIYNRKMALKLKSSFHMFSYNEIFKVFKIKI